DGRTILSAFVVPHRDAVLTRQDLRAAMRAALPRHAVPHEWAIVESLATNAAGKIDRRRLAQERQAILDEAALEEALREIEMLSDDEAERTLSGQAPCTVG